LFRLEVTEGLPHHCRRGQARSRLVRAALAR
jgi:hypothetical protein